VKEILVAGLGNALMSDEGVGVAVLTRLRDRGEDRADLVDLGSAPMRALHTMAGRRKAVFIDCCFMDERPGTIRRFTPDEVSTQKALAGLSLHEGDLLRVIALSRSLGECSAQVVIFGIQPQSIEPGDLLSPLLSAKLDEYADAVAAELG
jgi:hydrogenase maturation protease